MTASLPKLLIVDGFNVLRCGAYYAVCEGHPDFDGEALNSGREALIDDVALFAGHDYQAVVVFDGAGNVLSAGESQQVGQVEVIFSPAGTAADTVIEMRVKQAVGAGQKALVVTSDAATQWTVLG
ncbi:MAG: NYN domain-containing protein, partial [Actinomycetia bacterium]|nr:NYN domain-containing protein [Actinomycetes bacterium]